MKWLVVLVAASGCATLTSPRLPYEARVYLLDAEEDLMTAATRADEAAREVERSRRELTAAKERHAGLRESPLKKEAQTTVALASAKVNRSERSAELLTAAQACAEKRYAAARAQAEVKFKVEGAGNPDPLAARADACEATLDKRREALSAAEEALAKARAEEDRASAQAALQAPAQYPRPWLE